MEGFRETELVFSEISCRADKKGIDRKVKSVNHQIADFCQSRNSRFQEQKTITQNFLSRTKLHLIDILIN